VWLIVALSFYIRSSIGQKTWRILHFLSFAMYIMGLLHGLFSGTDSTASWVQWYYWLSGGSLLFLFIYRIVNTIAEKLARRAMSAAVTRVSRPAPRPTQSQG
jgi:DMSO/TMAO reductase YedYZ heme-binding membrane subunit